MLKTYTRKNTITAEQFLVAELPWPAGVVQDDSNAGYLFQPGDGRISLIYDGDYIVSGLVVKQADFEGQYQLL